MPTEEVKITNSEDGSGCLLRLPPEVRRQIYTHAGLPSQEKICLDGKRLGKTVRPPTVEATPQFRNSGGYKAGLKEGLNAGFGSLHSLLLTCRKVYAELSPVLYSQNTFIVQDHRHLRNVRPCSLNHMTNLLVYVYLAEGGHPWRRRLNHDRHYNPHGTRPLDLSTGRGRAVLEEFKGTVEQVGKHFQPGRLHLQLVCDIAYYPHVDNLGNAEQVVDALRQLPILASCHLRLGAWRFPALSEKARELTKQLTIERKSEASFRFMDLPAELRVAVFGHTDLVVPGGEVIWHRSKGYKLGTLGRRSLDQQSLACQKSSENGCFCARFHAVSSPSCRCWQNPGAFFLVSKAFAVEARDFYFRNHRIIIASGNEDSCTLKKWSQDYAVTDFFTNSILPTTTRLLRSLSLTWHCNPKEKYPEWEARRTWFRTLQNLREQHYLDLDRLYVDIRGLHLPSLYDLRTEMPEVILTSVRRYIQENIWPLDDGPEACLPFGTRLLHVYLHEWGTKVQYISKKLEAESSPIERLSPEGDAWGEPVASRVTLAGDEKGIPACVEEVYLKQ